MLFRWGAGRCEGQEEEEEEEEEEGREVQEASPCRVPIITAYVNPNLFDIVDYAYVICIVFFLGALQVETQPHKEKKGNKKKKALKKQKMAKNADIVKLSSSPGTSLLIILTIFTIYTLFDSCVP